MELKKRLKAICAQVDFDLESVDPSLVERLLLLASFSETVTDAERMTRIAFDVFRHYEEHRPEIAFSKEERQVVVLGGFFSDIGKTGPEHADTKAQKLIIEMFAVEGVRDETQSIAEFLLRYFPEDGDARICQITALGLEPTMSIRSFWNLHSTWTFALCENAGLPPEVVAAAATHHLLDEINPEEIVGEDLQFTRAFGDNLAFDRAEKLVIVLDKYDALRRRARFTHEQTIDWLRAYVEKNPRFRGDAEFEILIAEVGATQSSRQSLYDALPVKSDTVGTGS